MRPSGLYEFPTNESAMKNITLALFLVPFLAMPAFAGSLNAGDKPMVVADNVEVGSAASALRSVTNIGITTTYAFTTTITMATTIKRRIAR